MTSTDYDQYVRSEWALFINDPQRAEVSRQVLANAYASRVLDVGCGAGQELLPFAARAFCVGIDVAPDVGVVGGELFLSYEPQARVFFARASAEALPFLSDSFEIVICRLALPYMDNARALREIARILAPGGALLLKIHHGRYYLRKLWSGLLEGDALSMVHAGRVLLTGLVYHLTGRQIRLQLLSQETFQTRWLLRRELARLGLVIQRELPGSNSQTPFFLIEDGRGMN